MPANSINAITQILKPFFFAITVFFFSCTHETNSGNNSITENVNVTASNLVPVNEADTAFTANITTEKPVDILCILQDKKQNYWFGTNGGAYLYNPKAAPGKNLKRFTDKDGLAQNQIQSIQEDVAGNIWFGTGGFGVTCFDGISFKTYSMKNSVPLNIALPAWTTTPNDLWFNAGGGAYRYNSANTSVTYLPFPKPDFDSKYKPLPADALSPYAVYCTYKDSKGHVWFGTQARGVCRYNGKSFTWFMEKGLSPPAVRALFEDRNGNMWFGNNGAGLFRLAGDSLINLTKDKGLSNDEFWNTAKITSKSVPGTLARVWTISEDNTGILWIGTIDNGVWKYDGNNLTNYTTKDGLTTNVITAIYKDHKGEMWFGTDGGGICKFNGVGFTAFAF